MRRADAAAPIAAPTTRIRARAPRSGRVLRRIGRYRSTAGWLLLDLARTLPGHIAFLGIMSAAAIVARTATFSLLALFVKNLSAPEQAQEKISLGGFKIGVPDPQLIPILLVVAAALMAVTALVDSVLRVRVARAYSLQASRRVLDLLRSGAGRRYVETMSQADRQYVRRLVDQDVITLVRALRPVLSILVPVGEFVVAATVMTLIALPLSAAITLLVLVYLIPYSMLNRRAMRASRERETLEPAAHRQTMRVVESLNSTQYPEALRERVARGYLRGSMLDRRLHVLEVLLLNRRLVGALNNLFLVPVLAMLVVVIVAGLEDPVTVGAFGVLVSYAFNRLNATTKYIAGFNRFLPQFERYVSFLRGANAEADQAAPPERVPLSGPVLEGSERSVALVPGAVILSVQPYSVDWTTLQGWWQRFPRGEDRRRPTLVPSPDLLPAVPLRELVGASPDGSLPDGVRELLEVDPIAPEWERLRPRAGENWTEIEDSASFDLRFAVALAPALSAEIVVIPLPAWQRVGGPARSALLALLRGRTLILVSTSVFMRLPPDVTHVVLTSGERLIGAGQRSWFESLISSAEIHPELAALLAGGELSERGYVFDDDMLDDEGDDDDDDDDEF